MITIGKTYQKNDMQGNEVYISDIAHANEIVMAFILTHYEYKWPGTLTYMGLR